MRLTRSALLARAGVVLVLLLPWAVDGPARSTCSIAAPALDVDVKRACEAVRAAVPGWDGRATVVHGTSDGEVAADTVGRTVTLRAAGWAALSAAGRQEVLTHELVHVATDAFTTPRTPQWLVEGLAEAVALRGTEWPDRVIAQELRSQVARGWLPRALPSPADFEARPAVAYEESWLAVVALQRRLGDAAVLRLYRAAGEQPLARALRVMTVPDLVRAMRAEIVSRLS